MKMKGKAEDGEIRSEYDFSKGKKNPYAERANAKSSVVLIEPELQDLFPDSDAVNEALRLLVKAGKRASKMRGTKLAKAS